MATTQSKTKPGLTAKQAAAVAFDSIKTLLSVNDVHLEEVEQSEDRKYWLVTLGYYTPPPPQSTIAMPDLFRVPVRQMKVFKVDAQTGEVVSMKIREE